MSNLSYEDRENFATEIRAWAFEKAGNDYSFVIHPAMEWGTYMGVKASAVVSIPARQFDDDGANLNPNLCDCGKGEMCPLWDGWVPGDTKWTAIYRDQATEIVWWEQRPLL